VNSQYVEFSDDRLVDYLSEQTGANARDMIVGLLDNVMAFCAGEPQSDDITVLVLSHSHESFE